MKWQYLPAESAVLLDKIYKFDKITTYELGGEAAEQVLHSKGADAVHTTCYEQKSKVMGLKVRLSLLYVLLPPHTTNILLRVTRTTSFPSDVTLSSFLMRVVSIVCAYINRQRMRSGTPSTTTHTGAP